MAEDKETAQDEQAARWRERIKQLTSTGAAPDESENAETERSATRRQQESARDFIQRKMRKEKNKGRK